MGDGFDEAPAQWGGHAGIGFEQAVLGVACVAAEDLVAAGAWQHAFESRRARVFGAEVGRYRRTVAEWFIIFAGDDRNRSDDVGGLQVILAAAAAVALSSAARVFHFVKTGGVEADREGIDRTATCGGQRTDHG